MAMVLATMTETSTPTGHASPRRENLLLNIAFNIAAPSLILAWLSKPGQWTWLSGLLDMASEGPDSLQAKTFASACALCLALLFPVSYFIYDLIVRRKSNVISILGFLSVLATGGLGLLKVDGFWFAVKEASIPLIIGGMVLATQKTKRPLIRELLYNDQVIDTPRIDQALAERANTAQFTKLLDNSSLLLALGFLVSSVLNFVLARWILKSPAGTEEFNAELARMNWLSWPVIVLPTMGITFYALFKLLKGIEQLTGLTLDDVLRTAQPQPAKTEANTPKAEDSE